MAIRDRIKELRRVRACELIPNAMNYRAHPQCQRDALRGLLEEVGYADALLARELPDGTLEIVDGHLRAETTPDQDVPVLILDLDDAEATKVLATLDPLAAMAEVDREKLESLIHEIDTGCDALRDMLGSMAEDAGITPPDFQPTDAESQSRLDQKQPVRCPNCGHEFTT